MGAIAPIEKFKNIKLLITTSSYIILPPTRKYQLIAALVASL